MQFIPVKTVFRLNAGFDSMTKTCVWEKPYISVALTATSLVSGLHTTSLTGHCDSWFDNSVTVAEVLAAE